MREVCILGSAGGNGPAAVDATVRHLLWLLRYERRWDIPVGYLRALTCSRGLGGWLVLAPAWLAAGATELSNPLLAYEQLLHALGEVPKHVCQREGNRGGALSSVWHGLPRPRGSPWEWVDVRLNFGCLEGQGLHLLHQGCHTSAVSD